MVVKGSIGSSCLKKTALLFEVLFLVPLILSYNITVSPPLYDIKYDGGDRTFSFEICQDSGKRMVIPIITEVTSTYLYDLDKVRVKTAYRIDTEKCEDFEVKLTAIDGYNPVNLIVAVKPFNETIVKEGENVVSNIDFVKDVAANITQENTTIEPAASVVSNQTATQEETRRPGWYKWAIWLLVGIAIIGTYLAIKEYMTPEIQNEEE